jgi:glycerate dehydrogenase
VSQIALGFGMKVLVYDVFVLHPPVPNVEFVDLDTLFAQSDVVTLHCPLTPDTEGLIDAERLAQMKASAFLINTSRGAIVKERDLAEALEAGRIAGAGLDVLAVEPPRADSPLLTARNCLITPHIAWATRAARARLIKAAVDNLRAFLKGRPQNVVNRFAV